MHREVPSGFSGILKTLNHIRAVQEFWYAVIAGKETSSDRYSATELDR